MKIKNFTPRTIAQDLISIKPMELPSDVIVENIDGDTIHTYPSGLKVTYTDKPTIYEFGDYGHSFGNGFYVINEKLEHVYINNDPEEYKRIANIFINDGK